MPVSTRTVASKSLSFLKVEVVESAGVVKRTRRTLIAAATTAPDETPSKPAKKVKSEASTPNKSVSKKSTASTPRKKKTPNPEPGSCEPPKGWTAVYSLVEELREDRSAPVDTNGGEVLPQKDLGEKVFRFQVLIALMMSSQTKDLVVGDAMRALQEHGLTVENISATPAEELNQLIQKVGFHNNKTKYIKQAVEVLKEEYDGDIPPTAVDMMKLAGVGPKMAFIVENVAWGITSGVGVDTHMHRIFNELKWVTSKNPEQTRIQLESWLPREKWDTINYLWVGFGQEVQQFKPKMLEKALNCSRPIDALRLVKRLGLDYKKEATKAGLEEKLQQVLDANKVKTED
jgi:endonuclease-3